MAFSITVFQHIHPSATAAYLRTAARALSGDGYCLFQFLMNEKRPVRDSNAPDSEGVVSYTKAEVDDMVLKARLRTLAYAETWRDSANGNYWAWYKLAKAPASPPRPPAPAKSADDVPHVAGLISRGASSVLCVGCGMQCDGDDAPSVDALRELCGGGEYEVTGIDASPACVRWREQNGPPGRYAVMDARDVGTLGCRFDVVVCRSVIGRLPKADGARLPKADGARLLASLEGMYDRLLVVATPATPAGTGCGEQPRADRIPYEWDIAEFRDRGYYVRQTESSLVAFKASDPLPAGTAPAAAVAGGAEGPARQQRPASGWGGG